MKAQESEHPSAGECSIRKVYRNPRLEVYGDLKQITLSASEIMTDTGGMPGMSKTS